MIEGATLVVDDDMACDGAQYSRIEKAVKAAHNGDIIKICPGIYKIESTRDIVKIDKNDLTLVSSTNNPGDVEIKSDKFKLIEIEKDKHDITLAHLTLKHSKKDVAVIHAKDKCKNIILQNLRIQSGGFGTVFEKEADTIDLVNVTIFSDDPAIKFKDKAKNVQIERAHITSKSDKGIVFAKPEGDIQIFDVDLDVADAGIYLAGDGANKANFEIRNVHVKLHGNNIAAITWKKDKEIGRLYIENLSVDAANKGVGVWSKGKIKGDFTLIGSEIRDCKHEAVYIKKIEGNVNIHNNMIDKAINAGLMIEELKGKKSVKITKNIVSDVSNKWGEGLHLLSKKKDIGARVKRNCFLKNSYNAFNRDKKAKFSLNFFDDWSGSGIYEIPDIPVYDESPSSECLQNIHLSINEGSGDTLKDSAVGDEISDDATLHNTSWSAGVCDKGVYLNGSDASYISIEDSVENELNQSRQMSLFLWLKPEGSQKAYTKIVSKSEELELLLVLNKLYWALRTSKEPLKWHSTNVEIDPDRWNMIGFVYDGERVRIYKDGALAWQNRSYSGLVEASDADLLIGAGKSGKHFKGWIDEMWLYERALKNDEIKSLYDRGISCEPVGDWHCDNCRLFGKKNEITDFSSRHNNATPVGGVDTGSGKLCKAVAFDGASGYLKIDDTGSYDDTRQLTIMAWIYPTKLRQDNGSNARGVISKRKNSGTQNAYGVFFYNDHGMQDSDGDGIIDQAKLYIDIDSTNDRFSTKSYISKDRWTHIAIVYDGTEPKAKRVKVYLDGKLDTTAAESSAYLKHFDSDLFIGNLYSGNTKKVFKGKIDEVKIFKRALDANTIKQIYKNENSRKNWDGSVRFCPFCDLVVSYPFDEGEGSITADKALAGSSKDTGHLRNVRWDEGICGKGIYFDGGKYTYVEAGDSGDTDLGGKTEFTMALWIRKDADSKNQTLLNKENEYMIALDSGNKLWWALRTTQGEWVKRQSDIVVGDGWHFIALVYDGASVSLYYDDTQKRSWDYTGAIIHRDVPMRLGQRRCCSQPFKGWMDEFRLYDMALNDDEIASLFEQSKHCASARDFRFNAVSSIGDDGCDASQDWENNLTTQIAAKPFDLYILSRNEENNASSEANITKVELRYYASGNEKQCRGSGYRTQTLCDDSTPNRCPDTNANGCAQLAHIDIDRAVSCVEVSIYGRDKNATGEDINESNASDDFAVRPEKYTLSLLHHLYAAQEFNISVYAKDYEKKDTLDYNATIDAASFEINDTKAALGCLGGKSYFHIDTVAFEDGKRENIASAYDEIGDINITLRETLGSEFAVVDSDDTPKLQRLIAPASKIVLVDPYMAKIVSVKWKIATGYDWLYMIKDTDISEMNLTTGATLSIQNKKGDPLADFDETCYGKNVDVNFTYDLFNVGDPSSIDAVYRGTSRDEEATLQDINKTVRFEVSLFHGGKASKSYAFDINSTFYEPLSPVYLKLRDVKIDTPIAKELTSARQGGYIGDDQNATFYYARVRTKDLLTAKPLDSTYADILVYDQTASSYTRGWEEDLVFWYRMREHNNSAGMVALDKVTKGFMSSDPPLDMNIWIKKPLNGRYLVEINNSNRYPKATLHLKIAPWLWYSESKKNTFGSDSCAHHPCIEYRYFFDKEQNAVKSGDITGVRFDQNISRHNRGVKVFR